MDAVELRTLITQLCHVLDLYRAYMKAKKLRKHERASALLEKLADAAEPIMNSNAYLVVVEEALSKETEGDKAGGKPADDTGLIGSYLEGLGQFVVAMRPKSKVQDLVEFCRDATKDTDSHPLNPTEVQIAMTNLLATAQEGLVQFTRNEHGKEILHGLIEGMLLMGAGAVLVSISVPAFVHILGFRAKSREALAALGGTAIGMGVPGVKKASEETLSELKASRQGRKDIEEFKAQHLEEEDLDLAYRRPSRPETGFETLGLTVLGLDEKKQEKEERKGPEESGPEERLSASLVPDPPESHYTAARPESHPERGHLEGHIRRSSTKGY